MYDTHTSMATALLALLAHEENLDGEFTIRSIEPRAAFPTMRLIARAFGNDSEAVIMGQLTDHIVAGLTYAMYRVDSSGGDVIGYIWIWTGKESKALRVYAYAVNGG